MEQMKSRNRDVNRKLVVVLTKYPEAGKVKTRLARTIGDLKASDIQAGFIENMLQNNYFHSGITDYDFKVCLNPEVRQDDFCERFGIERADIFSVEGDDLGSVMSNIFEFGLKKYDEVILVGSDIPELDSDVFVQGFETIKTNDIVLGPCFDGGYYLIGMKQHNGVVFRDVEYSTVNVLGDTIKICKNNDLSYDLLETKTDIDEYKDIESEANKGSHFFNDILHQINETK